MFSHAVGRHYMIVTVTIPIFHALLKLHFSLHQEFDNQENSAFTQLLVFLLAIFLVEMTLQLQILPYQVFFIVAPEWARFLAHIVLFRLNCMV